MGRGTTERDTAGRESVHLSERSNSACGAFSGPETEMGMNDELLTMAQASARAGVPARTLRSWIDKGALPVTPTPGGRPRIRAAALAAVVSAPAPVRAAQGGADVPEDVAALKARTAALERQVRQERQRAAMAEARADAAESSARVAWRIATRG